MLHYLVYDSFNSLKEVNLSLSFNSFCGHELRASFNSFVDRVFLTLLLNLFVYLIMRQELNLSVQIFLFYLICFLRVLETLNDNDIGDFLV